MTTENLFFDCWADTDFEIRTAVTKSSGGPFPLDNATVRFEVLNQSTRAPLIEKTTAEGVEVPDPSAGEIVIYVRDEDTAGLGGYYDFRLWVESATGDDALVSEGTMQVKA